ncbi:MAG: hypothetical protein HC862_04555 [Scytonema sp. RU_4_4]|nr:hypothetical protein [Scytonema sp. RU_4_4]NJR72803.1 hypothetical protein [Scytonema sp. CRU_2_7]
MLVLAPMAIALIFNFELIKFLKFLEFELLIPILHDSLRGAAIDALNIY